MHRHPTLPQIKPPNSSPSTWDPQQVQCSEQVEKVSTLRRRHLLRRVQRERGNPQDSPAQHNPQGRVGLSRHKQARLPSPNAGMDAWPPFSTGRAPPHPPTPSSEHLACEGFSAPRLWGNCSIPAAPIMPGRIGKAQGHTRPSLPWDAKCLWKTGTASPRPSEPLTPCTSTGRVLSQSAKP